MPSYETLMVWHLFTVLPALVLGTWLVIRRKGTPLHRMLGRIYMLLMISTSLIALLMPAHVGPTLLGHFGWIHLLCAVVLWQVPKSWWAIRHGDVRTHRISMLSVYAFGLLTAGAFTLLPGRYLHTVLFG